MHRLQLICRTLTAAAGTAGLLIASTVQALGDETSDGTAAVFEKSDVFGERIARFHIEPDVEVHVNVPAGDTARPAGPILLILYALPNGNTTEQTIGRTLQPGDDWHFDIQHIGAQTRFLRQQMTNRTIVIAYLEAASRSWPAWCRQHGDEGVPGMVSRLKALFAGQPLEVVLTGHSGGGRFTFAYLNSVQQVPDDIVRIAFLDSNYAYDATKSHDAKLLDWLEADSSHHLCVLAYHDSIALLDGKTFVSAEGGTWGRSHAMLKDFGTQLDFTSQTNSTGLRTHTALNGRLQFLLKENPDKKILHTVQVERNGFIHAMLMGTPWDSRGYTYLGERAYTEWIAAE